MSNGTLQALESLTEAWGKMILLQAAYFKDIDVLYEAYGEEFRGWSQKSDPERVEVLRERAEKQLHGLVITASLTPTYVDMPFIVDTSCRLVELMKDWAETVKNHPDQIQQASMAAGKLYRDAIMPDIYRRLGF